MDFGVWGCLGGARLLGRQGFPWTKFICLSFFLISLITHKKITVQLALPMNRSSCISLRGSPSSPRVLPVSGSHSTEASVPRVRLPSSPRCVPPPSEFPPGAARLAWLRAQLCGERPLYYLNSVVMSISGIWLFESYLIL